MIEKLRTGKLIHGDETKEEIRGGNGYVRVFSSTQVVVYLISRSREGTILQETIRDFAGVLVSDFYEVSWEAEATIDGHSAVRRHYRGFTDPERASAFLESGPGDDCRSIDRRTGEAALLAR